MNTEELMEKANNHFTQHMGVVWEGYTDKVKADMIFGYIQGFLSGELHQINKRVQELQGV